MIMDQPLFLHGAGGAVGGEGGGNVQEAAEGIADDLIAVAAQQEGALPDAALHIDPTELTPGELSADQPGGEDAQPIAPHDGLLDGGGAAALPLGAQWQAAAGHEGLKEGPGAAALLPED